MRVLQHLVNLWPGEKARTEGLVLDAFGQFCCLSQVVNSPLLLSLSYGQERFGLTDRGVSEREHVPTCCWSMAIR